MLVLTTIKLQKHRQNKKALSTVSFMFCYFTVRESRGERNQFIHQWFWKLPSSGQLKERKGIETSSRNPKEHPLTRASCSSMAMVCPCTASSGGRPLNTFTKPFTKLPNLSTLAFKCRLIWKVRCCWVFSRDALSVKQSDLSYSTFFRKMLPEPTKWQHCCHRAPERPKPCPTSP